MSVHFGPSFYTEIDKIIKSYDDRLNYDAKFCEKKKIIKFIFYLDELEQDKIIEIQQKCVKIFIDENEKNPSIFKLTIERESSFVLHVKMKNILKNGRKSKEG